MDFDFKKVLHYLFRCKKIPDSETHNRRLKLKNFAIQNFENKNRCEIFVTITQYAVELIKNQPQPSKMLVANLKAVLIGRNMTVCRGSGAYFAGNIIGSEGFKKEFRDPWNQVQHAMAGIVIAFQYGWLAEIIVKFLETEQQDDKLYDKTFPLGRTLNDKNYHKLPEKIRDAIGE